MSEENAALLSAHQQIAITTAYGVLSNPNQLEQQKLVKKKANAQDAPRMRMFKCSQLGLLCVVYVVFQVSQRKFSCVLR